MTGRIGIIGGSGLYRMSGLEDVWEQRVITPFGEPSDALVHGRLGDAELVFLPRHGRGHHMNPSEVPYRANLWALKSVGCDWVISISAVGSLKEEVVPGHVVVVDQFIDRTKGRDATFFEGGVVAHVAFGDPVCGVLRGYLLAAATEAVAAARERSPDHPCAVHDGGTYVCMEGPAFSTRAESNLYRSWGGTVIGMTNLPEAKLAREAELAYATVAMATDYDCWFDGHDDVTVEAVMAVVARNSGLAQDIVRRAAPAIAAHQGRTPAMRALETGLMTVKDAIPKEARERLGPLLSRHLPDAD